jgi:hypothetical protein
MKPKKQPEYEAGRAKDRIRKTLSLPEALVNRIQAEADKHFDGDFTRATLELLATRYPEAKKFLRENTTFKYAPKSNAQKKRVS